MKVHAIGVVGSDFTLSSLQKQLEGLKDKEKIDFYLSSPGGAIDEGMAIYDYFNSLPNQITVHITGQCYSMATIIALIGDERKISENSSVFFHLPLTPPEWMNREDLKRNKEGLLKAEDLLIRAYMSVMGGTREQWQKIMEGEKEYTATDAVELGLATDVVKFNHNNKIKDKVMAFMGLFNKAKKVSNKVVQDAAGLEIDFPELGEGEEIKEGTTVEVGGEPIEDGVYMLDVDGETIYINTVDGKVFDVFVKYSKVEDEIVDKEAKEVKEVEVVKEVNVLTKEDVKEIVSKEVTKEIVALKELITSTGVEVKDKDVEPKITNRTLKFK